MYDNEGVSVYKYLREFLSVYIIFVFVFIEC